ncbi:MAG: DUF1638 domain-containing protein [Pseudomonadota bacterium]
MNNANSERVKLIACGMLAREVLDLIAINRWEHVDLQCLPAELHHHPDRIPAAVERAIGDAQAQGFGEIVIGYADCGTGGALDVVCQRRNVRRLEGPHCFALYLGLDAFNSHSEKDAYMTTFFITDFLARHPETFFFEPLGLDRHPELSETYFAHYERALYIAQTDDPDLTKSAQAIAERLGLAFERQLTGYGDLGNQMFPG